MQEDIFSINPSEMRMIFSASQITCAQKGIFYEILNEIWLAQKSNHPIKACDICLILGCSESDISDVVAIFEPYKWLIEEFDLTTFEISIKSPMLESQIESNKQKALVASLETKKARREREISEKKLMTLVVNSKVKEPPAAPRVAYLDLDERTLNSYVGWLPTTRFIKNGEVYRVTEDFMNEIKLEFNPSLVDSQILEIHRWLVSNPTKRKTLAKMPEFIRFWLKNHKPDFKSQNKNEAQTTNSDSQPSLDEALAKLMA